MKLVCYALRPDAPVIRPAPPTRPWMDGIAENHAYRCLPLNIANSHGWEILSPCAFEVQWTGGTHVNAVSLRALDDYPHLPQLAVSHFSYGIVTFHLGYLFRTEPGWDLLASGSLNRPKDGIAPLAGVIETDWLPYPFTMNWQMTRPGSVRFDKDEPLCMIYPVPHAALQDVVPEIVDLEADPELKRQTMEWKQQRDEFMRKFEAMDPRTRKDGWQRYYFLGKMPDGSSLGQHLSKLRLAVPVDKRKTE
ncbi:MAG TPA: DUF6065 family protein [Casimicrobiaceae bacterium]|nr:DUF6065 family protein [Casimicrobiaceae bacterium]